MFRYISSITAALTLGLVALDAQSPAARRVAITIDDGPVVNEMTDLGNFQRITNGLVGSFQVEKVPVTIFINERQLEFLEKRKYRVAHVTVDYADYTFAGAYGRELRRGNIEVAETIKQAYLDQVDVGFAYAERSSVELHGREVAQILLIHCNELNSVTLRESIARMRKRGYTFISLDEAAQDPAYERPDTFAGPGGSWLSRTATAMGKQLTPETVAARPVVPKWITDGI